MRVKQIHFNHDPKSATHDAINLIHQDNADLNRPEWTNGMMKKPVAYAKSEIILPVTIEVVLTDGPPNTALDIQAIARPPGPFFVGRSPTHGESPLGGVASQRVEFDQNGASKPILFETDGHPDQERVGMWAYVWSWQAKLAATTTRYQEFCKTAVRVYVIPALPHPPWTQDPADPNGWSLPWSDALDKACMWSAGTYTVTESTAAIVRAINEIGFQKYSTVGQLISLFPPEFQLKNYLHYLNKGAEFSVNCRDVASAAITFANLLGDNLQPLDFMNPPPAWGPQTKFFTNAIRALSDPNFAPAEWGFHEVSAAYPSLPAGWPAETMAPPPPLSDEVIHVYDACVHLPGNVLPLDMKFGSVLNGIDYRNALIDRTTGDGSSMMLRSQRHVV